MVNLIFPHRKRTTTYKTSPGKFGNIRSGGNRTHAGCDLYAPQGTEILAMADGKIIQGPYHFYLGTYALEVKQDNGMVVRYGEISQRVPRGIQVGARVSQGQVIAKVGKLQTLNLSMLHLEMYRGDRNGALTQTNNTYHYCPPPRYGSYNRRSDLLDPTDFLDNAILISDPLITDPIPQDGDIGTVNAQVTTVLNVRSDAKLSAPVKFTLKFGEICIILEKVIGDTYSPNQNQWYKVQKGGEIGYAAASYIDVEEKPDDDNIAKGQVNHHVHTVLNVRSQASTNSDILFELSQGATCNILNEVKGDPYPPDNQTEWFKIKQGVKTGFAGAYYIDKISSGEKPAQPSDDNMAEGTVNHRVSSSLNVRSKPSTNAEKLFSLSVGETFKVLEEVSGEIYDFGRTDWYKIEYKEKQGYVAAYYVDINLEPQPASRWDKALMEAPTTGASATTASQDGLPAGVQSSHKMAQNDLQRVKAIADRLVASANKFGVPAAILAAIASRESRCGNVLNNQGWGDCHNGVCYGFGIMQVDKRSHSVEETTDPASLQHIEQATGIFVNGLKQVQQKHPDWEDRYVIKGAAVAYNAGLGTVQTIAGMDRGTTGNDYGSDVIARAQYYANHADLSLFRINH